MTHPWDGDSHERNWAGYFVPGTTVLRNKLGPSEAEALRDAENDLVEARLIDPVSPRSFSENELTT